MVQKLNLKIINTIWRCNQTIHFNFHCREIHGRLRSWQGLDNGGLVGTLSGSVSGHSGSQHSSTGPSNNTGSTNLSSNTHPPHLPRPYHPGPHYQPPGPPHSPAYSAPYQPPPPPGMVPGLYPRLSVPVGHPQPVYLAQRSNVMGGSPVTIRVAQPQSMNMGTETQLANLWTKWWNFWFLTLTKERLVNLITSWEWCLMFCVCLEHNKVL